MFELENLGALLAETGIDANELSDVAGLPAASFDHSPVRLTPAEYFAMWEALGALVCDPALAVRAIERLSVKAFSPSVLAALCEPDLNRAADRLCELKARSTPIISELEIDDQYTEVRIDWHRAGQPPRQLAEFELLFWVWFARTGTRRRVVPLSVTGPPFADVAAATGYLGVEPIVSPEHAVRFSVETSEQPFLTHNDRLKTALEIALRSRNGHRGPATTERVRAALAELLPTGDADVAAVSRALGMSRRTLQRQLQVESTSFRAVLADLRQQLATHYLDQGDRSVTEIARLLGYHEPTSFQRAFRAWTGRTPIQARPQG